jgi:hypothetical protein
MIILPRQARDKHRLKLHKRVPFSCKSVRDIDRAALEPDVLQKKPGSDYHGWAFGLVTVANIVLIALFLWALNLNAHEFVVIEEELFDTIDVRPAGHSRLQNTCFNARVVRLLIYTQTERINFAVDFRCGFPMYLYHSENHEIHSEIDSLRLTLT